MAQRKTETDTRMAQALADEFSAWGRWQHGLLWWSGAQALYLSWENYWIHGKHDTRKIGRRSSNGCIGLCNENIAELFGFAKVGTQVKLI
jgi:lipoprotein-anchoring transpeptidase ErfK/SrfK